MTVLSFYEIRKFTLHWNPLEGNLRSHTVDFSESVLPHPLPV